MLEDDDARVGSQAPIELAVSHVERDHLTGATLEQHVGEAASRRADVERRAVADVDREGVERVGELHTAAADIWVIRSRERNLGVRGHTRSSFRDHGAIHAHLARHNKRASPLARRRELAFDEEEIEALATRHGRCRPELQLG
jgi:hypothetical protein